MFKRNGDDTEAAMRARPDDEAGALDEAQAADHVRDDPPTPRWPSDPAPEPAVEPVQPDRAAIRREGPYRNEGAVVFDARGRRVALCGYDGSRTSSGPAFAEAVAAALNRL